jgi:hypothetical protein
MPDLTKISDEHLFRLCSNDQKAVQICANDNFWRERYHVQFPEYAKYHDGRISWRQYYNDTVNLLAQPARRNLANSYINRVDLLKILESLGLYPTIETQPVIDHHWKPVVDCGNGVCAAPGHVGKQKSVVDCNCGKGLCFVPGHDGKQKPVVDNRWKSVVDCNCGKGVCYVPGHDGKQKPVVDQGGLLLGAGLGLLAGGAVGYQLGRENQRRYDYGY